MIILLKNKQNIYLLLKLIFKYVKFYKKNAGKCFIWLQKLLNKVLNLEVSSVSKTKKMNYLFLILFYFTKILSKTKKMKNQLTFGLKKSKIKLSKELLYYYNYLIFLYNKNNYSAKIKVIYKSHNVFLNILDPNGKNLKTLSSGSLGFVGREKSTLIACRELSKVASKFISKYYTYVSLDFIGKKGHNKAIIEGLLNRNIIIWKVSNNDRIAHGGCRLKKKTRK